MFFSNKTIRLKTLVLSIISLNVIAIPKGEDIINCFSGHNKMYAIKPFLGRCKLNRKGINYPKNTLFYLLLMQLIYQLPCFLPTNKIAQ